MPMNSCDETPNIKFGKRASRRKLISVSLDRKWGCEHHSLRLVRNYNLIMM